MNLSKRMPFPVGIPLGALVGAVIGATAAGLLVARRRADAGGELVAHTPSVTDFARFAFAAWALIQIANGFLGSKKEDTA